MNDGYILVCRLCTAVLLYFKAPTLCRHPVVFYIAGVGVGVIVAVPAALGVIIYEASWRCHIYRYPRGTRFRAAVTVMIALLIIYLGAPVMLDLREDKTVVAPYMVVSAAASFDVCYRLGPPSNPNTLNVIQRFVRLAAIATLVPLSFWTALLSPFSLSLVGTFYFCAVVIVCLVYWWLSDYMPNDSHTHATRNIVSLTHASQSPLSGRW